MNKIEQKALALIKSKMNIAEELIKIKEIEEKTGKKVDVDQWVKNWGLLDLEVIKKYTFKHGMPFMPFVNFWVSKLNGQEQLQVYLDVKDLL